MIETLTPPKPHPRGTTDDIAAAEAAVADLERRITDLPAEIEHAWASGDAQHARRLEDDLEVAKRQIDVARRDLDWLTAEVIDVAAVQAHHDDCKVRLWLAAEQHHPANEALQQAIADFHRADNALHVARHNVQSGRITDAAQTRR